ncbi:MAG: LuxR C-terminal-related transcriptional regulator [Candidatus Promineifilaceae bacterium]
MINTLLQTKLYIPPTRANIVPRTQLLQKLNDGLHGKLTLASAPAGFGKTTLITDWLSQLDCPVGWVSLDEDESDPQQFFRYMAVAIQSFPDSQHSLTNQLQSSQPASAKSLAASMVNDLASVSTHCLLVLDDYHEIESTEIDLAFAFVLDHMPPNLHLVITSRTDPGFPLSRLRARNQLTELRAQDLRFTKAEAAQFLQQNMNLTLSSDQIVALETRTEGWVAGLQMAALSMQNRDDVDDFVTSFTGSHRFIMDYLVEEVLNQQSIEVQNFLLKTSVLTRLCAELCDQLLQSPPTSQQFLEQLETNNIFLIPLDNERRWFRYHHLFADLLQQRLRQSATLSKEDAEKRVAELHNRASEWYEDNGLELDAFHHAAAANNIERTERLIEGAGVPLHYRGSAHPVLHWLESLPTTTLDARPSLWVTYASALFFTGQHTAVEQKLQAAEACLARSATLREAEADDNSQDLVGRIASLRATLAVIQHDPETIITQSRQALQHLHPDNLLFRSAAAFTLGVAYNFRGDRPAASQSFTEVLALAESFEHSIYTIAAAISLGQLQEADNKLLLASKTYERVLEVAGDPPQLITVEAFLGLARISYQWNDLDIASRYGKQCTRLLHQQDSIDTFASYSVFLAQLMLAREDVPGAVEALDEAEAFARRHNFLFRLPDVAAAQVLTLLRQGNLTAAARLAEKHYLPLFQARVLLAQGNTPGALALLEPLRQQIEAKGWHDERLRIMILQALVLQAHGEKDEAVQLLGDALALAEPGGFIRLFVDEGLPMAQLLSEAVARGIMPNYCGKLLAVFEAEGQKIEPEPGPSPAQSLIDPLTDRELEILTLIAAGLKNKEIAEQLVISLNTVLYHIKNIYSKLGVNKRTLAIAKAKELNLL